MQDLIDMTNDAHYENYRSQRLSVLTGGGTTITTRYGIILIGILNVVFFPCRIELH